MSNTVMAAATIVGAAVLGGAVLGGAYLMTQQPSAQPSQPRYSLTIQAMDMPGGEKLEIIYRLDMITGMVEVCSLERLTPPLFVHPDQPAWCAKDFTRANHP